jgi:hypothetical protein
MVGHWQEHGAPSSDEWPSEGVAEASATPMGVLLREWSAVYVTLRTSIATAIEEARSPATVHSIRALAQLPDVTDALRVDAANAGRWLVDLKHELEALEHTVRHLVRGGTIWQGATMSNLSPMPEAFFKRVEAIHARVGQLRDIPATAVPPASVSESPGALEGDDAPAEKLPKLQVHDRQAWQLSLLAGMTQSKVAEKLNEEHGTSYKQPAVSRMIARAKAHAEASGLAAMLPREIDRPRTVDPSRLALGARTDARTPRPSDIDAGD